MSRSSHEGAAAHPDHAAPAAGHSRGYRIGTILAIVLTIIPFWLVMADPLHDARATIALIFAMGLAQIVVHVVCFLHLDTRSEGGWTLLAVLFTTVIVVLTIGGSIWVMYHLNANMMPMPGGMAGGM